MKTPSKRILLHILAAMLVTLFAAGCSTVRGIGRDVGTAGEHIEDSTRWSPLWLNLEFSETTN
jgi:predicted small secreted protein